ncbi:probable RNA-binding protein CG14230 [Stomoxys calcitrans]|uniref:RRM domain-containing protein n=1 Tax=Stomoxys calcitrans TaxID=35570 RepID=A0A1I8P8R6_STOCA|nr:probable RNA-binding protein CG14230 [Stomoxys calcitrans]
METSRFFVANLPANTKDRDLRNLFQDYGEIRNIELKTKDNLVDPNDVKVIAFVTLNIGADDANYCLRDLNWQKINGQQIKVSLAKESFLERLKREREEAKAASDGSQTLVRKPEGEESELLRVPKQNKRRTFDIDADLDEDEVAAELMITKKRAANSLHNGKIVIQSQDVQPIHVIEIKKKTKSQLDDKSMSADQKRKESLNKMKNQYQQQKTAIQEALQGMDSNKKSKKIKFSDAESDPEEPLQQQAHTKKSQTNIFGSEDEDGDNDNIQFKDLPVGRKGDKLVQMQAKQSLDPRFRIDAKFVEDDDEEDEEEEGQHDNQIKGKNDQETDERQWQMNILEQVVGTKLDTLKSSDKIHKNKKMLRYDPSKEEHQKFERSKEEQNKQKKSNKKVKETTTDSQDNETPIATEVSKEVFYVVTDTLQESLRSRGEGFSLLSMFGKNDQLEERDEQLKKLGNEKILVGNKLEKALHSNPFTYDSTSESEAEAHEEEQENSVGNSNEIAASKKTKNKLKIAVESFFIPKNDQRLKDGASFFIYNKSEDAAAENYEEVRNRLKKIIRTKITKTKKNLANAGYKIKRKGTAMKGR